VVIAGGTSLTAFTVVSGSFRYAPIGVFADSATESNVQSPVPVGGTLSAFTVNLRGAPSSSGASTRTYTFTLRKGASSTSVTCLVTGTSGSNSADTCTAPGAGTVSVAAGDLLDVQITGSSNTNMGSVTFTWSAKIT
jgi:hypothetical protein